MSHDPCPLRAAPLVPSHEHGRCSPAQQRVPSLQARAPCWGSACALDQGSRAGATPPQFFLSTHRHWGLLLSSDTSAVHAEKCAPAGCHPSPWVPERRPPNPGVQQAGHGQTRSAKRPADPGSCNKWLLYERPLRSGRWLLRSRILENLTNTKTTRFQDSCVHAQMSSKTVSKDKNPKATKHCANCRNDQLPCHQARVHGR